MLQIVSTTRKLWGFPFQPIQWDPQYRIYLPVLSRLLRCILYILISLILSDNYWSLIFTIITNLDYHQWFLCNGKQMKSGAISQVFANPIEDPQSTNTPPLRYRVYIVRHDIQRLTLQINMDGLEVAKSSASSLYPVMVIRNELPPTIRQRNILVPFLFRKHGEVDFSDNLLKILREMTSITWTRIIYSGGIPMVMRIGHKLYHTVSVLTVWWSISCWGSNHHQGTAVVPTSQHKVPTELAN